MFIIFVKQIKKIQSANIQTKNKLYKFGINIYYFCLINCFLAIGHIWAFFGIAFNDSGEYYDTIIEAMPTIIFFTAPIVLGSVIFIFVFKKAKYFIIYQFLILQLLVVLGWSLALIKNYVPNSTIYKYIAFEEYQNNINEQKKINEQILKELDDNYVLIDLISDKDQSVAFYLNKEKQEIIVEHTINQETNYSIVDSIQTSKKTNKKTTEYYKYNSDYYFKIYEGNVLICDKNGFYYTGLERWPIIYNSNGRYYSPVRIYITLVKESIHNKENIYFLENTEGELKEEYENIKNKENKIREELENVFSSNFIFLKDFDIREDFETTIELFIKNDDLLNNQIDFCNKLKEEYNNIKKILNKYNLTSKTIRFKFENKNPFANEESVNYKDGGYIRDAGALYMIYLNPTPVEIKK